MRYKKAFAIGVLLILIALVTVACATGAAEEPAAEEEAAEEEVEEQEAAEEAPADEEEEPAAEEEAAMEAPTELKIAVVTITPLEEPWNTAWLQSFERVQAEEPYGMTLSIDVTENVAPPDAERVLREYAQTGEYPIIWAHSAYADAIANLKDEFPDILWAYSGSGNEAFGGNTYWGDVTVHEPAYLMGIIAGMMTETDTIGAVAAFPFPNVNGPLNAYIAGAESVNSDVDVKVTYIESWFDPPKAQESASAQIAAGADFMYAERFGPFEAAMDAGDVLAFGHFVDQNSLAPEIVVTSTVARWDPVIQYVIDAYWAHVTEGEPYDGPMDRIMYSMAEGGSDIAPLHDFEDSLPEDVLAAVEEARGQIVSGELVVENNEAPIE